MKPTLKKKEVLKVFGKDKIKCQTLFLKPRKIKKKKQKKPKAKRTNFFKAINWSIFKIDPVHLLSRAYYWIDSLFWLVIGLIILFNINFANLFSSVIKILLLIPIIILLINSVKNLIQNIYYSIKFSAFKNTIDNLPRVNFLSGGPGCGKSSLSIVIVTLRAKNMWSKLKIKAFYFRSKSREKLSPRKQKEYDEVMFAYNYYLAHPNNIPCLWTNIPLEDFKGRKSFKLKKAHLFQKKKLPIYSVLFNDEIGNQFEAKKGSNESLKPLSTTARFIRHFFDGAWHVTEQEISKTFVDIRRVSGSNKWLYQQKWKMKPKRLVWLFEQIKALALYHSTMMTFYKPNTNQYLYHEQKSKKQSKHWTWLLNFLLRLISGIGWRSYEYQELGNSESKTGAETKHGFTFVPSCLTARYDDRAYREMYKAKNLPIEESEFTELTLTDEDLAEMFPEEEKK